MTELRSSPGNALYQDKERSFLLKPQALKIKGKTGLMPTLFSNVSSQ